MGQQITWRPAKEVYILIPENCEHVTLHGNRGFAVVIRNLDMEQLSWVMWDGLCYPQVHEPRHAGSLQRLERGEEWVPWDLQKEHSC